MTDLKLITFTNIHSVNLYLNSPLEWGNFTIKFNNILENNDFGYGKEGSVVVYGDVEYCYNPCDENSNSTNDNCNWCDPQSTLIMDFERCVFLRKGNSNFELRTAICYVNVENYFLTIIKHIAVPSSKLEFPFLNIQTIDMNTIEGRFFLYVQHCHQKS